MEILDLKPPINVAAAEYKRLLGLPADYAFEGRVRELADWASKWFSENARPWIYAFPTEFELANERLRINGSQFSSGRLHDSLFDAEARHAMLVAVSAGPECEQKARELWDEGKPDEYFFLEVYGSAVVEHLVTIAGARICAWAEPLGMAVLPHYSPGYSGWDVADQTRLFEVIRSKAGVEFASHLRVFDSGMLQPKKSLLAVFGYTHRLDKVRSLPGLLPCENCSFAPCQYRRRPYRHTLPPLEDVADLQPPRPNDVPARPVNGSGLTHEATYSLNSRALRKWSQERLRLRLVEDQSFEARFRYDGTTCSNLGRPIQYDYVLKLAPSSQRYTILHSACHPAPEDTGHQHMCEYLNNPDALMRSISAERPFVGRPLDDVLTWTRPYSPAGCYCDADSRNHKWGLVLEVIHFALVQHEKNLANEAHSAVNSNISTSVTL